MRSRSITVNVPVKGAKDRFGNPTETAVPVAVDNVLIAPGSTENLEASRPDGVQIVMTLEIPKSYTGTLEGCTVELPEPWDAGNPYKVVGCPLPYMDENTPGDWDREVGLESAHG